MSARFCHACGAAVQPGAGFCTACGRTLAPTAPPPASGASAPASPAYAPAPAYAPTMAPPPAYQPGPQPVTQGMAIAALLVNALVWAGLGSLIAGRQIGWGQGFLALGGLILTITIIGAIVGIPMMIGAWIWGIVTGVQLIQESNAAPAADR